jgi:octaprenyl-diphosphate synthase
LEILRHNGSLDFAMRAAYGYADVARAAVAALPDSEYKRALLWAPDFVVAREK